MCVDKPEDHDCLVTVGEPGGELRKLKKDHQYYYQCQCQIFVTGASYCDFVIWIDNKLHVERILPDDEFWCIVYPKAKLFFYEVLLPEMCGKYFTSHDGSVSPITKPLRNKDASVFTVDIDYCTCGQGISGENYDMVKCTNASCPHIWFHYKCVGIKQKPRLWQTWKCPECKKLEKKKKN